MKTHTRDKHSPANMDPAAYDYYGWIYQGPVDTMIFGMILGGAAAEAVREEIDRITNRPLQNEVRESGRKGYYGNWIKQQCCDHCGAHFHYGDVYKHLETGELITVGWQCSEGSFSYEDKQTLDHARMKREIAGKQKRGKIAQATKKFLDDVEGLEDALTMGDPDGGDEARILSDMRARLLQYGPPLSEKQIAFALKLAGDLRTGETREARAAKAKADRVELLKDVAPWTEARQTVQGEVIGIREPREEDFYPTWKWLVQQLDGKRVWGTVPGPIVRAICDEEIEVEHSESTLQLAEEAGIDLATVPNPIRLADPKDLKGKQVRFDAAIQPKDDDPHFAYYKRPTKPEVIG